MLITILMEIENKRSELKLYKLKAYQCHNRYAKRDLYKHIKKLEKELGKLNEQKRNYTL